MKDDNQSTPSSSVEMEELKKMVARLTENVASLVRLHAETQGKSPRTPKIKIPCFDGNSEVEDWLLKCDDYFKYDVMDDVRKVAMASGHLESKALAWHEAFAKGRASKSTVPLGWLEYKLAITAGFRDNWHDPMADFVTIKQTPKPYTTSHAFPAPLTVGCDTCEHQTFDISKDVLQEFDTDVGVAFFEERVSEVTMISSAHHVFDEMSKPTNEVQTAVVDEIDSQSDRVVSKDVVQGPDAHEMLGDILQPDGDDSESEGPIDSVCKVFNELAGLVLCSNDDQVSLVDGECTLRSKPGEFETDSGCLSSNFHNDVGGDVLLGQQFECLCIEEMQVTNRSPVFDEMSPSMLSSTILSEGAITESYGDYKHSPVLLNDQLGSSARHDAHQVIDDMPLPNHKFVTVLPCQSESDMGNPSSLEGYVWAIISVLTVESISDCGADVTIFDPGGSLAKGANRYGEFRQHAQMNLQTDSLGNTWPLSYTLEDKGVLRCEEMVQDMHNMRMVVHLNYPWSNGVIILCEAANSARARLYCGLTIRLGNMLYLPLLKAYLEVCVHCDCDKVARTFVGSCWSNFHTDAFLVGITWPCLNAYQTDGVQVSDTSLRNPSRFKTWDPIMDGLLECCYSDIHRPMFWVFDPGITDDKNPSILLESEGACPLFSSGDVIRESCMSCCVIVVDLLEVLHYSCTIFVYDPGGFLGYGDIFALDLGCFLILEDKDHFKGSVLIHTKKGIIVFLFYLFVFCHFLSLLAYFPRKCSYIRGV